MHTNICSPADCFGNSAINLYLASSVVILMVVLLNHLLEELISWFCAHYLRCDLDFHLKLFCRDRFFAEIDTKIISTWKYWVCVFVTWQASNCEQRKFCFHSTTHMRYSFIVKLPNSNTYIEIWWLKANFRRSCFVHFYQ